MPDFVLIDTDVLIDAGRGLAEAVVCLELIEQQAVAAIGLEPGVCAAIRRTIMPSNRLVDGEKSYEGVIVIARSDLGDEAIRIAERRRLLRKHGSQ